MNTKELDSYDLGLHYKGCYSSDKLPAVDRNPFSIITNTDPANLPGTHWVAIYVYERIGEYFDSGGQYPPMRIENWLNRNCLDWSYNKKLIQQPFTETCGKFCLYFVAERPRHHTIHGPLNVFSSDLSKNERIIDGYI